MYIKGEIVDLFGSKYLVQDVYRISDEEIKEYELIHKNRVVLVKVSGINGMDIMQFGISA